MRDGLAKTRKTILGGLDGVFRGFSSIGDGLYDELEELLIASDMGAAASADIIGSLRQRVKSEKITEIEAVKAALLDEIARRISGGAASAGPQGDTATEPQGAAIAEPPPASRENTKSAKKSWLKRKTAASQDEAPAETYEKTAPELETGSAASAGSDAPAVLLVIGVNGVGKTTTIGKLANIYVKEGKKVIVAAADTFRAAAVDQLAVWCGRAGVEMIRHQENSDPAAVVFDAIQAAKARKADVLVCDTAGRLHNKKNLMEELRKIFRIIRERYPEARREVYLVIDATTGQNGLQQAKLFKEAAEVTGIVLTKMDGTAKGGIIVPILGELGIPVRYVGVGEGIDDLQPFDAETFARALLEG